MSNSPQRTSPVPATLVHEWQAEAKKHALAALEGDCEVGDEEWCLHRESARIYRKCADQLETILTASHAQTPAVPDRETIAKAIHARRYHLDAKDTNSMFAWYAEKPAGTDRSRMAIYSALQDADAVLAALSNTSTPGNTVSASTPFWPNRCHDPDSCARHFGCMYVQCPHMQKDGNDLAEQIRAVLISSPISNPERKD